MQHNAKSIRPFVGAKSFAESKRFYREFGFEERTISHNMSLFLVDGLGFYLQDAFVQDWVDNTMLFLEVENVDRYWLELVALNLPAKFNSVKLSPVRELNWGKECFVHDPSGILWHIGQFQT